MTPSWDRPEVTLAPSSRGRDAANAAQFGLPVASARDPGSWQIVRSLHRITLCSPAGRDALAVELDLGNGPLARRVRQSRRDEPLPRAIGLHRRATPPTVFDATAGLCRDAMVLAHLGCTVTAVERVPALAFLAHAAIEDTWLAARLVIRCGDSLRELAAWGARARPDVVYLDPMFETHGSAQVKKDMQACRALAGPPDDPAPLLAAARAVAGERVVVKRDPGAPPLGGPPSFAIAGERVRFDVYVTTPQ